MQIIEKELKEKLKLHKMWLAGGNGGERLNLAHANLENANLENADLRYANLENADLRNANLENADLRYANLRNADLRYANLRNANLVNADLRNANLENANLRNANLENIGTNHNTIGYHIRCPEVGAFIGWKKAKQKIIKLQITENAKRSSATSLKCRCSEALVLEIEGNLQEIASDYDDRFIYKVGEIVKVDDFDNDRWSECSTGIHFFINKQCAIKY
jgi:hypothetical protein